MRPWLTEDAVLRLLHWTNPRVTMENIIPSFHVHFILKPRSSNTSLCRMPSGAFNRFKSPYPIATNWIYECSEVSSEIRLRTFDCAHSGAVQSLYLRKCSISMTRCPPQVQNLWAPLKGHLLQITKSCQSLPRLQLLQVQTSFTSKFKKFGRSLNRYRYINRTHNHLTKTFRNRLG